jgi:hypothetical protein
LRRGRLYSSVSPEIIKKVRDKIEEQSGLAEEIEELVSASLAISGPMTASECAMDILENRTALRGIQVNRKDKDVMKDSGGSTKKLLDDPDKKPPREHSQLTPKRKTPESLDKDNDKDPDDRKD